MKPQLNDRGRVKVRFMEIDVEGGSSAILEGLRTVTAAFSKDALKTINGAAQPRVIAPSAQAKPLAPKNGELFHSVAAAETEAEAEEIEQPLVAESDEALEPPKTKKRAYPNCELLKDLNVEAGSPNLRDFAEAKKPDGNNEKYMVCAAWMKNQLNLTSFTLNHFYTCFRALGWKVPKDAGQPLRNMKKKTFMQNTAGDWELHSNGEQLVARLPQRD
jgi:hypothetical protein